MRCPDALAARAATADSGLVSRYVPPFCRDPRVPRRDDGEMEPQPDDSARRTTAGRPVAGGRYRGLLRAPQGGTTLLGPRTLRRLVHRAPARSIAVARQPPGSGTVQAAERQGDRAGSTARVMDREGRLGVRQAARHSV